jgi:multiple sugar transport system ATP-binding protein
MNLFEATIAEGAQAVSIGSQQLQLPVSLLTDTPELRAYAGRRVVLGVRPEDMGALRSDDNSQTRCVLEGRVDLVEALGSEQLIHFTTDAHAVQVHGAHEDDAAGLDQGTIRQGGEGVARTEARTTIRAGDAVRFYIDPGRVRFFDPDTTQAIGLRTTVADPATVAVAGPAGPATGEEARDGR